MFYSNPRSAILASVRSLVSEGDRVLTPSWQGKQDPEKYITQEILNLHFNFWADVSSRYLKDMVKPNLPWADDHFLERIGGEPLNPGVQYRNWPYWRDESMKEVEGQQFTHTYMERFWAPHKPGIRYPMGNIEDLIRLLKRDPLTRQAYLPIWFPEDTGASHKGRVPCTLGYQFLRRNEKLHIFYDIRSCDALRHFQDDIYLTIRLLYWILEQLRDDPHWKRVAPGMFHFHAFSFHCFTGDIPILKYRMKVDMI